MKAPLSARRLSDFGQVSSGREGGGDDQDAGCEQNQANRIDAFEAVERIGDATGEDRPESE